MLSGQDGHANSLADTSNSFDDLFIFYFSLLWVDGIIWLMLLMIVMDKKNQGGDEINNSLSCDFTYLNSTPSRRMAFIDHHPGERNALF